MYNILAVDDAKDTLMLLEFDLVDEGYQVVTANGGEAALKIVNEQNIDLILLDMYMPGLSGLATLEQLKSIASSQNIPVIMLSASNDEDEIVAALELGADDYVTKPYIAKVLLARIRTALRLMEKTVELERLAKTDFLTNINNRGSFEDLATKAISQCVRNKYNLVIAMFDIDFFKQVNDVHGHEAGDKVLIAFSAILAESFRDYDIVGRIGGEEFAVCMPDISQADAQNACERLRERVECFQLTFNQEVIAVTVSIGMSKLDEKSYELHDLLRNADDALYQAKSSGRNKVISFNNDNDSKSDVHEPTTLGIDISSVIDDSNHELSQSLDSSAEPSEQYPGIDYSIGVANVLGDDNLFSQILDMFYEDHHQDAEKINQAIETLDHETIKHMVHTLKGVACSVGAMQLFEFTKILDHAINNQESDKYVQLFQPVQVELIKVMSGIEQGAKAR